MSQRFIRCRHCGIPHDVMQVICPSSGRAIRRAKNEGGAAVEASRLAQFPAAARVLPTTTPPPGPSRDLFGKTIGEKYLVRSVLGEGGMGTVFEAEHLTIGRSVAVKVLHPKQALKRDSVKRFHQEARAAGAIGHPNICEVYDLGTLDDGSPYLVMEKLVGETLADRIAAEGGLPFDDVIDTLVQVLSGLVAAHEKGIVHRDIKPENVFLTSRVGCPPLVKLLDFGVSKVIAPLVGSREDDLDLTRTGMVMGTPYYMSPEQARGDRNLDARVDLYACGVILYEALTGRRPFTAPNYNALLLQILHARPRPARDLRPALPVGFDAVIEKAMACNRDHRYRTAAGLQRDLQALRDRHRTTGQGAAGRAMHAVEQPPSWPPRPSAPPATRPAAANPSPRRAVAKEPTPSSVEIPIVFSPDTPLSGEHVPMESAERESRPPPTSAKLSDAAEFEGYPTEVRPSPFELGRPEEASTTVRIARKLGHPVVSAQRTVWDTDVMGMAPVHVPDARLPLAPTRPARSVSPDVRDKPVDVGAPSHPSPAFLQHKKKLVRKATASPDDTIKADSDMTSGDDPTQLMGSRPPKLPRR